MFISQMYHLMFLENGTNITDEVLSNINYKDDQNVEFTISNVIADDTFNGSETYSMTRDEALAYIRWLREKSKKAEYYKKNWTEGQMLREWQYHKTSYNLFKWQNDNDERTFAYHFKEANFEEEQNFVSYILRILGNLLIG